MKLNQQECVKNCAAKLVSDLNEGKFRKNHRTNHEADFTGGLEDLHRYEFNSYLGSCGCFLMDMRLNDRRRDYHG